VEGTVLPFRQVEVSAPVSSRILEMKAGEGDPVKEGQPLAILYGKLEDLEMQRAKALLDRREFEAKSAKRLYESKIIPENKAMESRVELDLARLQYETAVEQVHLRTILAPIDGVVVARHREVGETVATAQPLFRILDLSRVWVICDLDPKLVVGLAQGQKVRVHLPQLPESGAFEGIVALVDPCTEASGLIRVKVLVENPNHQIRSGLRALVNLPSQK
jgi:RND family efflux transporter MFP subunit